MYLHQGEGRSDSLSIFLARISGIYSAANLFAQLEFGQALNFQKLPPVDDKITLRFAVEFRVEIAAQFLKILIT